MTFASHPDRLIETARVTDEQGRLAGFVIKTLSPEMKRAAAALLNAYEALHIELITTPRDAAADLLAAMPVIDGHENEIRQMVIELVGDMHNHFHQVESQPIRLRFAYQSEDELLEQLLSPAAARLVVLPIENEISLHGNVEGSLL